MATKTIIVMSDSHDDREIVKEIKSRYIGKVDAIFHNGDSELDSLDSIWDGIYVVLGNCDFLADFPTKLVVDLDGFRIVQTHGHLYNINFSWDKLDFLAQEEDADLCLYGHLHRPAAWKNGKTLFLNPGSISQPRGEINEKLYAKVEISDERIKVDFLTRKHQIFSELSQEFKR